FFPYGTERGDEKLNLKWNALSETIYFSNGVPFGPKIMSYAHVSANGALTFEEPRNPYYPDLHYAFSRGQNVLAPFWSYVDSFKDNQYVYYHLYEEVRISGTYFYSVDRTAVLQKATQQVQEFYEPARSDNFKATTVLIVTWVNLQPHASWYSEQNNGQIQETNTFQVIYATNGEKAYAITIYKKDGMNWQHVPDRVVAIGFAHEENVVALSTTSSLFTTEIGKVKGTAGRIGTYIVKVGEASNPAQMCSTFYQQNWGKLDTAHINQLPQCPCTMDRLGRQWWLVERRGVNHSIYCYAITSVYMSRNFPGNPLNKLCCYLFRQPTGGWNNWLAAWRQATYITGTLEAGHVLTRDPFRDPRRSQEEDFNPKNWCCRDASRAHCDRFNEVRPDQGCSSYSNFVTASLWGDPHITTLDERHYTLNGWAEYVLLTIPSIRFMLQARTDRADAADGTITNATVFVAFAVRDGNDGKLQVELSHKRTSMVIFSDGVDITTEFYAAENYSKSLENFTVVREESSGKTNLVANFPSGVSLKFFMGIRSLEVSVEVAKSLQGNVSGLLGNFNGKADDDFILPDGTTLDVNKSKTERNILENFGKPWEVTMNNSIFTYPAGEGPANYRHPEFIPFFKDEMKDNSSLNTSICGDNDACIFDYLATRDKSFAENTRSTSEQSVNTQVALKNQLPTIRIPSGLNNNSQWEVTAGQPASITVQAEDADGDAVTYLLVSKSDNVTITTNGTVHYHYPDPTKPVEIIVQVKDSKGGFSNVLPISLLVCPDCSGHGHCDNETVIAHSAVGYNFGVHPCKCLPAYTGSNCEEDFDGCSDSPCAKQQNCTDMTATEQWDNPIGYKCGPCPAGFEAKLIEEVNFCTDINECSNSSTCDHNCTNTVGSFVCFCHTGYRLNSTDQKSCIEINECVEQTHNCEQRCNNTPGGYSCSCFAGYKLVDGNCTQEETNEEKCKSLNCSQLCLVEKDVASCTCKSGYSLNADNKTCSNVDECQLDKRPCSQNCTDNDGGFTCSCSAGFYLAGDKTSCTPCDKSLWGDNCSNRCQCNGRGSCDPAHGCRCNPGWEGDDCNSDIDECKRQNNSCSVNELCVNTEGGFSCQCHPGSERKNEVCTDIDECLAISSHRCDLTLENCINTNGSYRCECKKGFARKSASTCHDIDECQLGLAACQHTCVNTVGSYNCRCHNGFVLSDDRRECIQDKNVCGSPDHLNCSHGCTVEDKTPKCFCNFGYQLGKDNKTCEDIDECQLGLAACQHTCVNTVGSYNCRCHNGFVLSD
ncbi:unnamed protein product, partial [Lymnaea stagnalis]